MYDLKSFIWDAVELNITVYGTLDASNSFMVQSPISIMLIEMQGLQIKEYYTIYIGTEYDDQGDGDQIRAHVFWNNYSASGWWNGTAWAITPFEMDNAGDSNWDVCSNDPNGTSLITIDITGVSGLDISKARPNAVLSSLHVGYDREEDYMRASTDLSPLFLLMMLQEPAPTGIPSYPPMMMISITMMMIIGVLWISLRKKIIDHN
jgi:hypothetical protein